MSLLSVFWLLPFAFLGAAGTTIDIATPMPAPEWATLERRILSDSGPAAKRFFAHIYDERGYFRHFVRWGANDGPDDAFENTVGWPELQALGADGEILTLHLRAWEGMLRQFTAARACTTRISPCSPTGCTMAKRCGRSTSCRLRRRRFPPGRGARGRTPRCI